MSELSEDLVAKARSSLFSWLLESALVELWKTNPWLKTPLIRYVVKFVIGIVIGILLKQPGFQTIFLTARIEDLKERELNTMLS